MQKYVRTEIERLDEPAVAGPLLPEAHNGPEGEGGLGDPRYLNPGPVDPLPKTGPIGPPTVPAAPDGASEECDPPRSIAGGAHSPLVRRLLVAGPGDPPKPGEPAQPPPQRPPEYQPPGKPMEEPFAPPPPPPQVPPPEPVVPPPQARG